VINACNFSTTVNRKLRFVFRGFDGALEWFLNNFFIKIFIHCTLTLEEEEYQSLKLAMRQAVMGMKCY